MGTRGIPPLSGNEHPRFVVVHGEKEWLKSEGVQKLEKVLLVNYTLSMEIGISQSLISHYKHTSGGFK